MKVAEKQICALAEAVRAAYRAGEEDETLEPLILVDREGKPVGRIADGDYVIFYDLRGEREIELTRSFTEAGFAEFPTQPGLQVHFVTMIDYDERLNVRVAFPSLSHLPATLSEAISNHGWRQVKIAESEKAVHVTYFLNGKRWEPFPGEEWIVIPSPRKVAQFDQKPEMSAAEVAEAVREKIEAGEHELMVANFANVDVVGHVENEAAIRRAVETVDTCLGRALEAAQKAGVTAIVTADHGTVEKWLYPEGAIDTGHTASPVPFIFLDPRGRRAVSLRKGGTLTDVAPTILEVLGLPQPEVMTGRSLVQNYQPLPGRRRLLLLIADGWGWREEVEGNLIAQASTPVMDRLQTEYPATRLQAAGEAVGLPPGAVGNSEVGHLHLGAGRVIPSDRVRIDQAIADGSFFANEAFLWAMREAKREGKRLHLLGILSFYSSHGSVKHLLALLQLARREGVPEVYLHALLGRRGERPESGALYLEEVQREADRLGGGKIVTVIGRYWALDREENWDRVEKTYRALVWGEGRPVISSYPVPAHPASCS
ncbi:MAG TPA: phosphoglycerate mutase (2,3-diphosphoglycerate-independent) [Armatimonadetes bacterium]|nr:phosphoglycerate mutase (2,3-diphosphoglycerate-independent) [Armatimonadota bacterium]